MVNAAIVVYIVVIAYNTIFHFFTMHAEFLLKWRNQIRILNKFVFAILNRKTKTSELLLINILKLRSFL